jgi:hypothetical protein
MLNDDKKQIKKKQFSVSDTFDSLKCLDRALLRQLNEQEMNLIDTVNQVNKKFSSSKPRARAQLSTIT